MTEIISTLKCTYCGKEKPPIEMKQATIFIRERKWDDRKRKNVACVGKQKNWYCNNSSCHINDQMAHEG